MIGPPLDVGNDIIVVVGGRVSVVQSDPALLLTS